MHAQGQFTNPVRMTAISMGLAMDLEIARTMHRCHFTFPMSTCLLQAFYPLSNPLALCSVRAKRGIVPIAATSAPSDTKRFSCTTTPLGRLLLACTALRRQPKSVRIMVLVLTKVVVVVGPQINMHVRATRIFTTKANPAANVSLVGPQRQTVLLPAHSSAAL